MRGFCLMFASHLSLTKRDSSRGRVLKLFRCHFKAHLQCFSKLIELLCFDISCIVTTNLQLETVSSGTDVTSCLSKEISESFCLCSCCLLNSCHVLLPQCSPLNVKKFSVCSLNRKNVFQFTPNPRKLGFRRQRILFTNLGVNFTQPFGATATRDEWV